MNVHRAARYAAYAAAAVAMLIVAAALLLPQFLDTPAVERELKVRLSELVQGEVAWEKLSIRLLPSPRGSLTRVRTEIPGVLALNAEKVDAHLRLLPLFRGRAEIASVSLSKPAIRVRVSPSAPAGRAESREEEPADPVQGYRAAVSAVHRFAPSAVIDIADGEVEVNLPGVPQVRVRDLELHGRTGSNGLQVELTAASDAWSRMRVTASADFDDVSGKATVELTGLKAQEWLDHFLAKSPVAVSVPDASLRVDARSDGKARLEADFDVRATTVDLARGPERVQFPEVAMAGKVSASGQEIGLRLTGAQLGASKLGEGTLNYALKNHSLSTASDFDLDLAQAMDATRRLLPEDAAKSLSGIQPVSGRAQGQAKFELARSGWRVGVDIRKSDSSVGLEGLPGPVNVAAASVSVTQDATMIERADVSVLDATAVGSATISYGKSLKIDGVVSEASIGKDLLAWAWKKFGAPRNVELRTPIRIAVERVAWSPDHPLDLAATASFDSGPKIGVELSWTPKALDVRRATLKDERSDALHALHVEEGLLEGRFSGALHSASIGAMLKGAAIPSGGGRGDIRFRIDLKRPERSTATGKLTGESMDLGWLLGRPVAIERANIEADGNRLRITQASVNWAQQRFALRGEVARAADGAPIVDAQIESPGVVIDALLQRSEPKPPAAAASKGVPGEERPVWTLWPLPVRGRVAFQSKFIEYGERKAEPVAAVLTLEAERASLDLQQVQLCGISFPLTAEARPKGQLGFSVQLAAKKQQLEQTALCLTERGVQIDGEFDLSADLRTSGTQRELISNLEGSVQAEARDGKVKKFDLLGKILSTQSVASMFKEGGPKVDEKGFPYRSITAKGRFEKGAFVIDESFFRSDIIGIAANGLISLSEDEDKHYDSKITVLVAPLGRLDQAVRSVPVLGYLLGGTLTSVPVGVSGDIRSPRVVPLGPSAVLSELGGVFERALQLPGHVLPKAPPPSQ
jgi:hypothetical protein